MLIYPESLLIITQLWNGQKCRQPQPRINALLQRQSHISWNCVLFVFHWLVPKDVGPIATAIPNHGRVLLTTQVSQISSNHFSRLSFTMAEAEKPLLQRPTEMTTSRTDQLISANFDSISAQKSDHATFEMFFGPCAGNELKEKYPYM